MEVQKIMENRIATFFAESTENRMASDLDASPMRNVLEELFVWCQDRFPDFNITAVEMQSNG
jgi:hypothetical protein